LTTPATVSASFPAGAPVPADLGTLVDRYFLPTAIEGYTRPPGSAMRLWFHPNEIAAIAGCNSIWALAAVEDGRLVTTGFGGTLVGCSGPLEQEQLWLEAFLNSKPTITADGPSIRLESGGVVATFTDEEVADPDYPLEGRTWVFDAIGNGTTAGPMTGTLTFDAGSLRLEDGCTTGSATYATDASSLITGAIEWRPADCPAIVHPDTLTAALADPVTIDIAANRLTLTSPNGTIMQLHTPR
jgi:heat shock protein HslJ